MCLWAFPEMLAEPSLTLLASPERNRPLPRLDGRAGVERGCSQHGHCSACAREAGPQGLQPGMQGREATGVPLLPFFAFCHVFNGWHPTQSQPTDTKARESSQQAPPVLVSYARPLSLYIPVPNCLSTTMWRLSRTHSDSAVYA